MPVRALVEAGALFGIAEGSMRVALTRALADGLLERDERGAYRLGGRAHAVAERVAAWRRLETRVRPWSGGWLTAIAASRASGRAAQRRHARALRLLGFRELRRDVAVRPDNLVGGIDTVRAEGTRFELAPGSILCELHGFDALTEARARALWDADELVAGYRRTRRALDASAEHLAALPENAAMTESFRLGGAGLRQLTLDPLLPEPIVPGDERAALVAAMRRYDAAGRSCWSAFLARHGVRHRGAPADTRAHALGGFS